jgi:hypothetical protein
MKHALDLAANIATVLACAAVAFVLIQRSVSSEPAGPGPGAETYRVGESLDDVAQAIVQDTDERTVILFLSSTCQFCTKSMPFYRRLAEARQRLGFHLVALGRQSEIDIREYLAEHDVTVDKIATVGAVPAKLTATPTLIVADPSLKAQGVWVGFLQEQREREVLQMLDTKESK